MKKMMFLMLAMLGLAACSTKQSFNPEGKTITISAKVNVPLTRVTSDNIDAAIVAFKWQAGDQVVLWDGYSEQEIFTIVDGSISSDGKSADFTGKALSDMSFYAVVYAGKLASAQAGVDLLEKFSTDDPFELNNSADNFNLVLCGDGADDEFTLDQTQDLIHMKLTGTDKIGKVEYCIYDTQAADPMVFTTIHCPGGVQLSSTPIDFCIPFDENYDSYHDDKEDGETGPNKFAIKFYNTSDELIMTKVSTYALEALGGCDIYSFPQIEVSLTPKYFCFTAMEDGATIKMKKVENYDSDPVSAPTISLEYSSDLTSWNDFVVGTTTATLANTGDKVYFRAKTTNNTFCNSVDSYNYTYTCFVLDKEVSVSGNIMYLLNGSTPATVMTSANNNAFRSLFENCTKLKQAKDLSLPATTLAEGCYREMFSFCTGLVSAPALPALTTVPWCYNGMFCCCESLVTAPALPATNAADYCYGQMFNECTSLVAAPDLPATQVGMSSYNGMFQYCTNLVSAPSTLPAETLDVYCYTQMFCDCYKLETAPSLPAVIMKNNCYDGMFCCCYKLQNAPALPGSTLAQYCYSRMFSECTSLVTAPALSATTLAKRCYSDMFSDCTNLVNAPALPAETLTLGCYSQMFMNCSSLVQAPVLPASTLTDNCYYGLFYNCAKLQTVTMKATDVSAEECLDGWLEDAGTDSSVTNPTLLVHSSMVSNSTILAAKYNFNVSAYSE